MKQSFTIGRDPQNDIVIADPSDLVSRVHAILKVDKKGHYKVVDQSTNGTYVNGIRLEKFAEVPVTRKDDITFASVCSLDWDAIPKPRKATVWIAILVPLVVLLLGAAAAYIWWLPAYRATHNPVVVTEADSLHFKAALVGSGIVKWDETKVELNVSGNVKWNVKVTDKDGNAVEGVTVEPESGEGEKTVVIGLPKNSSVKAEAIYLVTVSTEEKAKMQSFSLQITQSKKVVPAAPPTEEKKEVKPNNPQIF